MNKRNKSTIGKQQLRTSSWGKQKQYMIFTICAISLTTLVFIIQSLISHNNSEILKKKNIHQNEKEILTGKYELLQTIDRDNINNAQYTQGLIFVNETTLIESSGVYGQSSIHFFNLNNPNKLQDNQKLNDNQFGEGCDIINDKVYQLTWQNKIINIYELENLKFVGTIALDKKAKSGWGLTHRIVNNEIQVLITDGTNKVHVANSEFQIQNSYKIFDQNNQPVYHLNELEYVDGILYANVYMTSKIVAIDLEQSKVIAIYDFTELVKKANRADISECLNGIAYNQQTKTFWITGKFWPFLQEVKLY